MLWAQLLVKLFVHLIELAVQVKRRDDEEKRQERLAQAKSNPGDYLRQFGRVQHIDDKSSADVSSDSANTGEHNRD
jgi:hypothetical protein